MLNLRTKLLIPNLLTALLAIIGVVYISILQYKSFHHQTENRMAVHKQQLHLLIGNLQKKTHNLVELLSNKWRFLDSLSAGNMDILLNELTPFHNSLRYDFIGVYDMEGITIVRGDSPGHFGTPDGLYQHIKKAEKGTSRKSIVTLYDNKLLLLELKRLETSYGPIGFLAAGQYLDEKMVNGFARSHGVYLAFQYKDSDIVSSTNIQLPRNVDRKQFQVEFIDLLGQDSHFSAILWQDTSKIKSDFWNALFIVLLAVILMSFVVIYLSRRIVVNTVNDLDKARSSAEKELVERKRIEEALKQLNEELEERVQERTRSLQNEIIERKQAEKALIESEKQYRLLVENANDAIYIVQDEVIKFPNPKTEELTGYSGEELSRIPFVNHIHPDDRDMILDRHKRKLAGEGFPSTYSCKMVNRNGKRLWTQISTVPITWEGRPATLNFLRDITSERSLENQLFQTQKAEAIGTLAGGIAHDFNNILFPIVGFAEMVLKDISHDSPLRGPLNEVIAGARRARDLVKQILAFSRQSDQELKPLKIQLILHEVLELSRSTLPTTIEIRQDICKDCGSVMADPTQIQEVCLNLITNAYHAMEDHGGTMSVVVKEVDLAPDNLPDLKLSPGKYVCLTVADTGIGMDTGILEKMFDPYFSTKHKDKGTGLGLSVVHGIVKGYDGEIVVQSELGKGSEFNVYLPRIVSEVETEDGIKPVTLRPGNERILLVDDEEPIARMVKLNLDRLGYQVSLCNSSTDALEAFRVSPNKYDLVITDMTMPNITGDDLTIELKKIRPDIPVVLCTGFSEKVTDAKASAIGVDKVLMKPIIGDELARAVRSILHGE